VENIKQRSLKQVEKNRGELTKILRELIARPSISGEEKEAQLYYAGLLEDLGCQVDVWEPKPEDMLINPNFLANRDQYSDSPDVVGVLKGSGGGQSLLLNGHMDVVPPGAIDWLQSPWSGHVEGNRLYGRGAADMKAGLAANYIAVKSLLDLGVRLKGDVLLESVVCEKTGGAGTLSAIHRGYRADGAVVPEPTGMQVCPVSMGVIWFKITVTGKAAHAATTHLGVNAITKAGLLIAAVDQMNRQMVAEKKHPLYGYHPTPFSVNLGVVTGGAIPTSVPDKVVLEGRMSFSPDETVADAKKLLEAVVHETAAADEWMREHPPEVEWFGFFLDSGSVDLSHPFVKTLCHNYETALGRAPQVVGSPFGTDAGSLIRYGHIPTVIFGPGPSSTPHKANEYVDLDSVVQTAQVLACTLLDWCGVEE